MWPSLLLPLTSSFQFLEQEKFQRSQSGPGMATGAAFSVPLQALGSLGPALWVQNKHIGDGSAEAVLWPLASCPTGELR